MTNIPHDYRRKIVAMHGEEGRRWIENLPAILATLERRWHIKVLEPISNLSYGYVCRVFREAGDEAMLKITWPYDEEGRNSEAALFALRSDQFVPVLEHDPEQCAVLLHKIKPGTPLHELEDNQKETQIAAQLMRTIPAPIPKDYPFQTLAQWMNVFEHIDRSTLPFPATMLDHAKTLGNKLEATKNCAMLVHGDLHHDNILLDEKKGWLVIDPKGIIADPIYECARFLQNIWPSHRNRDLHDLLHERITILSAQLRTDPKRIAGWGFVDCIMSACWSVEDGEDN